MSTQETLDFTQIISNICSAGIPMIALIIALREINKWKKETLGKNRIELAQRIGKTAIGFRNAFLHITTSPIYSSEYADRPKPHNEYPYQSSLENQSYARLKRESAAQLILMELKELVAEAELLFRLDLSKYINGYTRSLDEMRDFINLYNNTSGGELPILDDKGEEVLGKEISKSKQIFAGQDTSLQDQVVQLTDELKKYVLRQIK